jgi:hypothetical protein
MNEIGRRPNSTLGQIAGEGWNVAIKGFAGDLGPNPGWVSLLIHAIVVPSFLYCYRKIYSSVLVCGFINPLLL